MKDSEAPSVLHTNQHNLPTSADTHRNTYLETERINTHHSNNNKVENIGMNIPYFIDNNIYDNMTIYTVPCLASTSKYYSTNFARIKCANITTEWIDGLSYSYLTHPNNIENKFYYLIRGVNGIFKPSFEWRDGIMGTTTKEKFDEFLYDVNNYSGNNVQSANMLSKSKRKKILLYTFAFLSMLLFVAFLIIAPILGWYIFFFPAGLFITSFFLLFCFGWRYHHYDYHYDVNKYYIVNIVGIERLINKWNEDYFVNQGIYVTTPKNFSYIQFNVDQNCRMELEQHRYPFELVPRGYHPRL